MTLLETRAVTGRALRAARAALAGSAIVLTYHRIADLEHDPQLIAVSTGHFAEQIEALASAFRIVPVVDLFEAMASGRRLPRRALGITLDDGYADALTGALPVLAAHGAPATVFVASDTVGAAGELPWDAAERAVLGPHRLPRRLALDAGGARFERVIGDGSDAAQTARPKWDMTLPPPDDRHRIYVDVVDFLRPLPARERERAIAQLEVVTGVEPTPDPSHRTLTVDELHRLDADGLIEIGAHTRSHALLSALPAQEMRDEITGGACALGSVLGHPVRTMSYPYGGPEDVPVSAAAAVREAGLLGALTTRFGAVLPWTDRFAVPRCPTEDIGGEAFLQRVEEWFHAAR